MVHPVQHVRVQHHVENAWTVIKNISFIALPILASLASFVYLPWQGALFVTAGLIILYTGFVPSTESVLVFLRILLWAPQERRQRHEPAQPVILAPVPIRGENRNRQFAQHEADRVPVGHGHEPLIIPQRERGVNPNRGHQRAGRVPVGHGHDPLIIPQRERGVNPNRGHQRAGRVPVGDRRT